MGKPDEKRELGRPRCRWEDKIKMNIREDRGQVEGTFRSGNEPSGCIKCGEFLDLLRTGYLLKKDSAPWSERVTK